jgi:anti-anti-sigma regulatory factor
MQLFLSWSGVESKRAADTLGPWLEKVCPGLQVWMSAHDIQAGTPWGTALHEQLKRADFGLLCLTPENLTSPWVLYEAGALAMSSKVGCVVPFLLDVGPEKLPAPLAQFQSVPADKEGTWKVLQRIKDAQGDAPVGEDLRKVFEHEWPDLARPLGLDARIDLRGDVLVVTPSPTGLESDDEVEALGKRLKALVHGGNKKVILDLAEVTTTTSMGLSLLWRVATFWKQEAEVVLANVSPILQELFKTVGLHKAIKDTPSLDEAFAYLGRSKEGGDG